MTDWNSYTWEPAPDPMAEEVTDDEGGGGGIVITGYRDAGGFCDFFDFFDPTVANVRNAWEAWDSLFGSEYADLESRVEDDGSVTTEATLIDAETLTKTVIGVTGSLGNMKPFCFEMDWTGFDSIVPDDGSARYYPGIDPGYYSDFM